MGWQQAVVGGATDAMTTPYGGGEWEVNQYSTLTPEQQTMFDALVKNKGAGKFNATQVGRTTVGGGLTEGDISSLSISGLNRVREEEALASLETFMNMQANQDSINAQSGVAKQEAVQAADAVNLNFAGRGSSSSASNRAKGQVESDLAVKLASIQTTEEEKAQQLKLQGASAYGQLAQGMTNQDLTVEQANQGVALAVEQMMQDRNLTQAQMDQARNIANAAATNQMSAAEAQFLLQLATAKTTENVATQKPIKTLHKDLWGGMGSPNDEWGGFFASNDPGSALGIMGGGK